MQVTEVGGSGVGGGGDVDSEYTLTEALDDLCCRFLLNLPLSEFESFERLFFAIESAHWFYDDFFRASNKKLPALSLKDFAVKLFAHTPLLQPYKEQVDKLFEAFRNYKQEVPKCGAAMLNSTMDRVLLVHGWGGKGRWSFPKGKLGKDETEVNQSEALTLSQSRGQQVQNPNRSFSKPMETPSRFSILVYHPFPSLA